MKNIVVPVDFSQTSLNAYNLALDFARRSQCLIHLVHVVEQPNVPSWSVVGDSLPDGMENNIYFIKLIEKVKRDFVNFTDAGDSTDVDVKTHLRMGKAYQNIAEVIAETKPDMIIMGSNGEDDIVDTVLGSNAEKVVRRSDCPVLVIKQPFVIDELKDIVLASEFDHKMDDLMSFIKALHEILDAKIHLVRINTPSNFERSRSGNIRLRDFAKKHNLHNCVCRVYSDFSEEDGILSYAEDVDAGMIAMTTTGRSSFSSFFIGSVSSDVINHAKRAVLTMKID